MKKFIKKTFTVHKIKHLVVGETIGKFVAFLIGTWSAKLFTYHVYERKGIKNLFGLMKRKEIIVHRVPSWIELLFAALIGFLVMELFYFLLQEINYGWIKRKLFRVYILLKWKF